jgi:hypothetical protein
VVALAVLAVKPPGPVHRKVAPLVADVPLNVTLDVIHVKLPETEAVAPGNVRFSCTSAVAVEVQPLAGLVTVTV